MPLFITQIMFSIPFKMPEHLEYSLCGHFSSYWRRVCARTRTKRSETAALVRSRSAKTVGRIPHALLRSGLNTQVSKELEAQFCCSY